MRVQVGSYVLRLVVFMLIIPVDTSEAERIRSFFSLMNDIKTSGRSRLCQQNLAAMMIWHYHGRNMEFKNVLVCEILKEFRALVGPSGRNAHTAAAAIVYPWNGQQRPAW